MNFKWKGLEIEVLNLHISRFEDVRKMLPIVQAGDLKKIFLGYKYDRYNNT